MKTILYMTVSIDGKITQDEDDTTWIEQADIDRMNSLLIECGIMIMGSKTYYSYGEFLPNRKGHLIVFTSNPELLSTKIENVEFLSAHPKDILEKLQSTGQDKVMICGGGKLNTTLINQDLIDEIRLIVKPLVLRGGKTLFNNVNAMKSFELITVKRLTNGTVELIYSKL